MNGSRKPQPYLRSAPRFHRLTALPRDWRNRLPEPATYFARHLPGLSRPNAKGWAQAQCPFHEDRTASFSVNVVGTRGHWCCFAGCGKGDLLAFHMRITGLPFVSAACELIEVHQ